MNLDCLFEQTPIQRYEPLGIWLKREDLFSIAGVNGGKVRPCWYLATAGIEDGRDGVATTGGRRSPQIVIASRIAQKLGVPCHVHIPNGPETPEISYSLAAGATLHRYKNGRPTYVAKQAREDAEKNNLVLLGAGSHVAVFFTRTQLDRLPDCERIVIPVGSAMNVSGLLWGLRDLELDIPVLGVMSGMNPNGNLKKFAPEGWEKQLKLVPSGEKYAKEVDASIGAVKLDPIYEAKCVNFLRPGDLFWIIGIRYGYDVVQEP
jgi:1-aminocyclopropane-1-carboxylate deaminase/D-cysteine desulfhydrase-like pyridoxal-dependent ACC family enzyme